jgi:hypothetical protein
VSDYARTGYSLAKEVDGTVIESALG